MGHCTYFPLVQRGVLCVFNSCYKLFCKHYSGQAIVWEEVRAEIRAFRGRMVFVVSEWCQPWSETGVFIRWMHI